MCLRFQLQVRIPTRRFCSLRRYQTTSTVRLAAPFPSKTPRCSRSQSDISGLSEPCSFADVIVLLDPIVGLATVTLIVMSHKSRTSLSPSLQAGAAQLKQLIDKTVYQRTQLQKVRDSKVLDTFRYRVICCRRLALAYRQMETQHVKMLSKRS